MRKTLIILVVLFGVFLAIGCAGNNAEKPATSNEAGTQNSEKITGGQAVTEPQNATAMQGIKEYTLEELEQYNGQNGKIYVAYQGQVYDVSASSDLWKSGNHKGCNAGEDVTGEIDKTPHGAAILKSYPVIGTLKQ
jgi:predicted heme/steroid binding protein